MRILDYFDRISIIHMKDRRDRYRGLVKELPRIGITIDDKQIRIYEPTKQTAANGFASPGVYSNFISHLDVLKDAQLEKLQTILIMEDDAIFSRRFACQQDDLMSILSRRNWGMCYFGHTLDRELRSYDRGLTPYPDFFAWAHCYAVHGSILPRLIPFLERIMANDPRHPEGGKLAVDGAFNHFRRFNPDVEVLVANPVLSVQRGSPSSLATRRWYDQINVLKQLVTLLRTARDESWRQIGWPRSVKYRASNIPASSLKLPY
jgi:glycosyl transferase, family 25